MAAELKGRISAMPVVSYASVSDAPPMVAVACDPRGFTCKLAARAGSFSLSLLDRTHAGAVARLAAIRGAEVEDKLTYAGLDHTGGTKLKVPVPKDAVAALECALTSKRRHGDHLLLVGKVKAASAAASFTGFWDYAKYRPILYTGWRDGLTTYEGT